MLKMNVFFYFLSVFSPSLLPLSQLNQFFRHGSKSLYPLTHLTSPLFVLRESKDNNKSRYMRSGVARV